MHQTDVLVIGGGVAGVAAALAARTHGAATTLVRPGPGATAMASGAWLDSPPDALVAALARAGLALESVTGSLPHPDGRLLPADVAPLSHARAGFGGGAELALVCGIAGLPGFRPAALATLWASAANLPAHALEPVSLTITDTPAAGWSPVSLSTLLEREPERLAAPLAHVVRYRGAARVFLPAVLGLDAHARVHDHVCRTVRVVVGECLGVQPSVPGWRLDRALLRTLVDAGVNVLSGRVSHPSTSGGRITSVAVTSASGRNVMGARCFVLATGKFIGGGITAERHLLEAALGAPVLLEHAGPSSSDVTRFEVVTDRLRDRPQALLAAGVRVSDVGLPLSEHGDALWDNVFAVGSVREATATAATGLGVSARDGWSAGLRAAMASGAAAASSADSSGGGG